ncbi:MAG: PEGA domain-containing protein [bacterium]|nr:PEGA domain-containing protein [bacterium]
MDKKSRLIFTAITILVLSIGTLIGIFLVQGNTLDIKNKQVVQNGVLVVNSVPSGAAIYIDEHFTNTTNTSIKFLPAKKYKVRLTKEGYIPWEKEIDVNKDIIAEIQAILWPATPAPNPLTTTGAINVQASPDKQKISYAIRYNEKDKAGIWVMDMAKKGVFSGPATDYTQIIKNTTALDFSSAKYIWSPDSKQILVTLQENNNPESRFTRNYVLDITKTNTAPSDVTLTKATVLASWNDEYNKIQSIRLSKLNGDPNGQQIASNSAIPLKWSYDGTMFLYATSEKKEIKTSKTSPPVAFKNPTKTATSSSLQQSQIEIASSSANYINSIEALNATYSSDLSIKVYDLRHKKQYNLPFANIYTWYPEEEKADRHVEHLVMMEEGKISMIETDGTNKSTIYSGPFTQNLVFPWTDGGRLVFLTNFNSSTGSEPNLYTLGLR